MGNRKSERMFLSFDPDGDIVYTTSQLSGCDIVAVLDMSTATPRYLTHLHNMGISYIVVDNIMQLGNVLETLNKEFGIKSISVQGGGSLNGAMLNYGLIDELSLVVYPNIECNQYPVSLFDQTTDSFICQHSLTLLSVQQKNNGMVWLRYKVNKYPKITCAILY